MRSGRLSWARVCYLATTGRKRRVRDWVLADGAEDRFVRREDVARRYISGSGIEIGPLTWPLRVPRGTRVRSVDYKSRDELMRESAHMLNVTGIPPVDVIDNAEELASFGDCELDFMIANHVLEHIEDPIAALAHWVRVVRPGGVLMITLPDAAQGFDATRERTSVAHLLSDHQEGPAISRDAHYAEWAVHIEGRSGEAVTERVAELRREGARHHFHVWELSGFLELLRAIELPVELEHAQRSIQEFIVVLRRLPTAPEG